MLPSCPEEAVNLPNSQVCAVSQPGTPQQSSESAQSIMENPFVMSEQPETSELGDSMEAAGYTRRLQVTIPAEGFAEENDQQLHDTGDPECQSQPVLAAATGLEAKQRTGVVLDRPHKSLPAHAFKATLRKTFKTAPNSRQLSNAWQQVEDSSAPESAPEASRREDKCESEDLLCTQEQLLRSFTKADSVLRGAGKWGFDTLELAEVSGLHSASCFGLFLFPGVVLGQEHCLLHSAARRLLQESQSLMR